MSRIGKQPIIIPENVSLKIDQGKVGVRGPRGELSLAVALKIKVSQDGDRLLVTRQDDSRSSRSLHGLTRTLIANMITGVTQGWQKTLELVGVGYRAGLQNEELVLSVGFSHPVMVKPPQGVKFDIAENRIIVSGLDKALVGQAAANIRAIRKPEPYKGKGIRYLGEEVRRKAGKSAKVGTQQ